MGMPPHFEELMQGSYASNDEPCANACSPSDMAKYTEDVSLPDSHALLHVTNRRKTNTMVVDSDTSSFELLAFC
jgi:centromeric protein E